MPASLPQIPLPSGGSVPVLGQGTWRMGEDPTRRDREIAALRLGFDLGMTLVDTAEMYGGGASERLVGEAIRRRREDVFLVSKVMPQNASRRGTVQACEESLRRLGTDWLDLYLLHWRGPIPLEETIRGFEALVASGRIRAWGVSNFDVPDLVELVTLPGGDAVQTDQVLYNLARRGVEYQLLPWCRANRVPVMAYSPVDQGRLARRPTVVRVAARHGATPGQVALAWVLRQEGVIAIPKASSVEHVRENRASLDLVLTPQDLADLDGAFPAPTEPRPLEVL